MAKRYDLNPITYGLRVFAGHVNYRGDVCIRLNRARRPAGAVMPAVADATWGSANHPGGRRHGVTWPSRTPTSHVETMAMPTTTSRCWSARSAGPPGGAGLAAYNANFRSADRAEDAPPKGAKPTRPNPFGGNIDKETLPRTIFFFSRARR